MTPSTTLSPTPFQKIAFALAVTLVFIRFGMLHQVQHRILGMSLGLLLIVGVPTILAVALAGGIRNTFRARPAWYLTAFTAWMILCVPFSFWRGYSFSVVEQYVRTCFVMLFVMAGVTLTWRQCRVMMYAIAFGGVVNLLTAEMFEADAGGRLSLDMGTLANPNDFAAHLLLVLPFMLWIALSGRSVLLRLFMLAGVGMGMFLVLRTASRGAFLALLAGLLFFLLKANTRQRVGALGLLPVAAIFLVSLVPQHAIERLLSFGDRAEASREAVMSRDNREYLLRKSLEYTIKHPVFGVGPGEFPDYEGTNNKLPGMNRGSWLQTHNSYTQISSECGIPGGLLLLAAIFSTFRLLNGVHKEARRRDDSKDIRTAVFCIMLGFVSFCVAAFFVNFGYFFYFPAMGGLAIAVAGAARREFDARAGQQGEPAAVVYPGNRAGQTRMPSQRPGVPALPRV